MYQFAQFFSKRADFPMADSNFPLFDQIPLTPLILSVKKDSLIGSEMEVKTLSVACDTSNVLCMKYYHMDKYL